jgi:hypothetical protein
MRLARTIIAHILAGGMLTSATMKLVDPQEPLFVTLSIAGLEAVVAVTLLTKWGRLAALAVCVLGAFAIVLGYLSPVAPCGCMGSSVLLSPETGRVTFPRLCGHGVK